MLIRNVITHALLGAFLVVCSGQVQAQELELTILFTHGAAGNVAVTHTAGGLVRTLRGQQRNVLLLDTGHALSPAEALFSRDRSRSMTIQMMNEAGYAAFLPGPEDLRLGDALTGFLREAGFPVLGANLHRSDTGRPPLQVQPYAIVRSGRVRIGLIGLSSGAAGVAGGDPVAAARYYVPIVRQRSDLVILLTHLSPEVDSTLAASVPGVAAILRGGPGDGVSRTIGTCFVADAPGTLAGADLRVVDGRVGAGSVREIEVADVGRNDPGDPGPRLTGWHAEMEGESVSAETVIGQSNGGYETAQLGMAPFGYLVADLVRQSAGADVALIRALPNPSLAAGAVRVYDLLQAYPRGTTVTVVPMKGSDILERLRLRGGTIPDYPSGVAVIYDAEGRPDVRMSGKPVDPRKDYTVALETDALPRGVTGRNTGVRILNLLGRHIRTVQAVQGVLDARIQAR